MHRAEHLMLHQLEEELSFYNPADILTVQNQLSCLNGRVSVFFLKHSRWTLRLASQESAQTFFSIAHDHVKQLVIFLLVQSEHYNTFLTSRTAHVP